MIRSLIENNGPWLLIDGGLSEREPELDFIPPKTLKEYLERYPNGIRDATKVAAKELKLALAFGSLDKWAKDITEMYLGFAEAGLEDIVAMFAFPLRPIPGKGESERFHNYIGQRVKAALPVCPDGR